MLIFSGFSLGYTLNLMYTYLGKVQYIPILHTCRILQKSIQDVCYEILQNINR